MSEPNFAFKRNNDMSLLWMVFLTFHFQPAPVIKTTVINLFP